MALPKIVVRGKKVILLSGYCKDGYQKKDGFQTAGSTLALGDRDVKVDAEDELILAAQQHPDAVAFGYVAGVWVASA